MKYAYQELFIYKQLDFDTAQTYAVDVLMLLLEPLLVRQSRAWKIMLMNIFYYHLAIDTNRLTGGDY
jgi:hypothetical protein